MRKLNGENYLIDPARLPLDTAELINETCTLSNSRTFLMTRIQGQEIERVPNKWCSQLKAPLCCEVGSGGREIIVSIFLAPHATAEVRYPFTSKLWDLAALQAFDCHRKNLSLGARL
jgi:hypothetical protein